MRIHNSRERFALDKNYDYSKMHEFKPQGLWYDFNGEWKSLCKEEEMDFIGPYDYEVVLDESKILKIKDLSDLISFIDMYDEKDLTIINWDKVKEDYSGVEFINYKKYYRLDFPSKYFLHTAGWWSSIDVSSGCVWDLNIIKELRLINDIREIISVKLRLARLMKGLALSEVGKQIDVTYQQIQKYENGLNRISAENLYSLAEYFGVDINWFFCDKLSEELYFGCLGNKRNKLTAFVKNLIENNKIKITKEK